MKSAHLLLKKLTARLAVCALGFAPLATLAVTGTWTNSAGGSWADATNWSSGIIPGSIDDTADFSTLTLSSAPVVTLDGATTVGNLVLGDVGNNYGWTLATGSGDPLTLGVSTGSPTITVNNQTNTISLALAGTQGLTTAGSGTLLLTGTNIYTGGTTVSSGVLQVGVASNIGLPTNGNVTISSGATFIFSAAAGGIAYIGQLSGAGDFVLPAGSRVNSGSQTASGSLAWTVNGTLAAQGNNANLTIGTLSGASTGLIGEGGSNTGRILTVGALNVDSTFNGTIISDIKLVKTGTGNLMLTGTNTYTGATTVSGGTLTISGAGQLGSGAYAGLITNNGALNFSSTAPQTLSGVISGTGSLTNNGPGTLVLSAVNTYSDPTILNGGTTVGVTAGACGFSSVTVASAAATLSVSITNNTTSWSCANMSFGAAGTLNFNFGAITPSGSVAPLVVNNAVAFTATPIVILQGTALGTMPIGSYPLMTWGSVSGTVPTAVVLPPHRGTANLSVSGNTLYLNITSLGTEPLYWAASSGAWDIGLSSNWKDSANNITTYGNPDTVIFEDTVSGASPIIVTLTTNVAPTYVTISNNLKSYTFAGTGAITGTQGLTKAGTNTLVLVNTNTYTGSTIISAGTLQLGDGVANNGVVAGGIAVSNGSTLAFAAPNNQTNTGVISGSGGVLVESGVGILTLSVANTYTGGTTINAGTMRLLRPGTINSSTVTVNSNGTLVLDGNNNLWTSANPSDTITLNGGTLGMFAAGIQGRYIIASGAVSNLPAASSTISLTVVGGGNAPPNASDLFLDGGLQGSGTITISNDATANGIGLGLRTSKTSFSGTLIVIGNASTVGSAESGLAVGNNPAQPVLTNADLQINGTMEMGNSGIGWANGTVNGQTLAIGALNGTGVVVANMATTGLTRGLSIGGNGHDGIFSGQIANGLNGTLSLIKTGSGIETLTGGNSYTGTTTVNGGTLLVGNQGSLAGAVTVQSGGTFGGDGALNGTVSVQGGTLTVGTNSSSAVDTLAIYNTLTFAVGSTNVMRISKNGGVPANDQITGLTSVTYGGTLVLVNTTTDGSMLAAGDTLTLYPSAGAYNGGFGNAILPALPAGLSWNLDNLTVNGSISVNNQVSTPSFTPPAGGYAGAHAVTISSATAGATIYFTTDGSTPTTSSQVYSTPIPLPVSTNSMTINAYATEAGFLDSGVASATYATVVTPTWLNPSGSSWSDTSSWSNTVVANGSGVTADFSTLTLPGDTYVTLDIPATVGALVFADQGNAYNWNLTDGGNGPLTLDSGINQPVITVVNTNTTISAILAGTHGFIKVGAGTLTLSGANIYTGNTVINAGVGELEFTVSPPNTTFVGSGTVEFNYTNGVNEAATFGSGFTGQLLVTGTELFTGTSTVMANNLGDVYLDTNSSWVINNSTVQADELTGSGEVANTGVFSPAPATLVLGANNGHGSNVVFSGPIDSFSTNNGQISIVKNGTGAQELSGNLSTGLGTVTVDDGTLTLSGTNTYTGATTVSNGTLIVNGTLAAGGAVTVAGGTLAGVGTIDSPVTVQAGGTISAGTNSIGTLTISNNLTLLGNLLMEVDKSQSPSNDIVTVAGAITNLGTGSITVMNLNNSLPLTVGDTFYPFGGQTVVGGGAMAIAPLPGAGLAWQNHLAVDGSITVVSGVATNPTNLIFTVSGGTLHMSWPADHLGWHLQEQTNSLTSTNWVTIPGSDTMTSTNIPIDPTKRAVFYRMVYP